MNTNQNPVGAGDITITVHAPSLRLLIHAAMSESDRFNELAVDARLALKAEQAHLHQETATRFLHAARHVMAAAGLRFAEDGESLQRRN